MNQSSPSGYRELPAPPELAPYLSCVWLSHTPEAGSSWRSQVLPDGCIDIVWIGNREPVIAGPATITMYPDLPPDVPIAGVRFRPGLASCLLGWPAGELRNQDVPLSELWSPELMEFAKRGSQAKTAQDRLSFLTSGLMCRLPDASAPDPIIQQGVASLMQDANLRVGLLGRRFELSERQLRRRFEAHVGYGPKMFGRILRMREALRHLQETGPRQPDLAGIAYLTGYADQAHMTREMTALADASPTRLLRPHG